MDKNTPLVNVNVKIVLRLRQIEESGYGIGFTIESKNGAFSHTFSFLQAADSKKFDAEVYENKSFTVLTNVATVPIDLMWLAGTYHRRLLGLYTRRENLCVEDLLFEQAFVESEILLIEELK